ncbi:MAG: hypothetical protein LKG20_05920 [Tetrasphaera jenkinsii]|jgi:hypothetical protein|nr:hypothetical protein [Tetrasphaera jenkinsii]
MRDEAVSSRDEPSLASAVTELKALLREFDLVSPNAMDSRFYIHAYNELDLAARTIIDAFDRERDTGEDLRHK